MGSSKKKKRKRSKSKRKKSSKRKKKKRRKRSPSTSSSSSSLSSASEASSDSEAEGTRLAKYSQTSSSDEDADTRILSKAKKILKGFLKIGPGDRQAVTQLLARLDKGRGVATRPIDNKKVRRQVRTLLKLVKTKKRGDIIYRTHRTPKLGELFMEVVKANQKNNKMEIWDMPILPRREIHDLMRIWVTDDVHGPAYAGGIINVLDSGRPMILPYGGDDVAKMDKCHMLCMLLGLEQSTVEIETDDGKKTKVDIFKRPTNWIPTFRFKDALVQLFIRSLARDPDPTQKDPDVRQLVPKDVREKARGQTANPSIGPTDPSRPKPDKPQEDAPPEEEEEDPGIGPAMPTTGKLPSKNADEECVVEGGMLIYKRDAFNKGDKVMYKEKEWTIAKVDLQSMSFDIKRGDRVVNTVPSCVEKVETEGDSSANRNIGPAMPTAEELAKEASSSDDDEFGPALGPMDDKRQKAAEATKIVNRMKQMIEAENPESAGKKDPNLKRESWLTVAPTDGELSAAFAMQSRKFKGKIDDDGNNEWMMTPAQKAAKRERDVRKKKIMEIAAAKLAKLGYTLDEALNPINSTQRIVKQRMVQHQQDQRGSSLVEMAQIKAKKDQLEWDRRKAAGETDLGERPVVPETPDLGQLGMYRDPRLQQTGSDRFGNEEML